jgi:hypothetical protein
MTADRPFSCKTAVLEDREIAEPTRVAFARRLAMCSKHNTYYRCDTAIAINLILFRAVVPTTAFIWQVMAAGWRGT